MILCTTFLSNKLLHDIIYLHIQLDFNIFIAYYKEIRCTANNKARSENSIKIICIKRNYDYYFIKISNGTNVRCKHNDNDRTA